MTRIGIHCLSGLKYIHDIGYVHRDIKPASWQKCFQNSPEKFPREWSSKYSLKYLKKKSLWKNKFLKKTFRGKFKKENEFWRIAFLQANLAMGLPGTAEAKTAHILDFGLARQFAIPNKETGSYEIRRPRARASFRLRSDTQNIVFKEKFTTKMCWTFISEK